MAQHSPLSHRVSHVTAIPLGRRLPGASSNLPGRPDPDTDPATSLACAKEAPRGPYSVLLPVGFAVPLRLPATRCALTAPFHPCRGRSRGGSFSVALSLRFRRLRGNSPPDVIRHRMSMEPGLSSPATFRSLPERPSGRLTCEEWGRAAATSSPASTRSQAPRAIETLP